MERNILARNYEAVQEALANSCARHGRKREEVTLVAVSKFHPAHAIAAIASLGQLDFGENYVQECLEKRAELASLPALRWHMTGHVQSRKANQVAGEFFLVHTLDSIKLANAFQKRLLEIDAFQNVLIEVNIADEQQKSGIGTNHLTELAEHVLNNCPRLRLNGLMCLPPVFDCGEEARPYFAKLRNLRDHLEKYLGRKLPELSMGMSGDFDAAIAEGATITRIGTDIFGPRPVKK